MSEVEDMSTRVADEGMSLRRRTPEVRLVDARKGEGLDVSEETLSIVSALPQGRGAFADIFRTWEGER